MEEVHVSRWEFMMIAAETSREVYTNLCCHCCHWLLFYVYWIVGYLLLLSSHHVVLLFLLLWVFFGGVGYLGTWKSRTWSWKFRNGRSSEEFHLWRFQFWQGWSDQSTDCAQRKGTLYCASKTGWWEAPLLVYCSWPQILYWQLLQIQLHWSSQLLPQPRQVHMDHSACSVDPLIFKIAWKNHNQLEIYSSETQ